MNKKANLVLPIIILVLAAVLVANLLIPTIKATTNSYNFTDNYLGNTTTTLTHTNVATIYSIANGSTTLAATTNYTESNGVITMVNAVEGLNYVISYSYYNRSYDLTTGETALLAVVVLAAIIGLLYGVFSMFGLVGKN